MLLERLDLGSEGFWENFPSRFFKDSHIFVPKEPETSEQGMGWVHCSLSLFPPFLSCALIATFLLRTQNLLILIFFFLISSIRSLYQQQFRWSITFYSVSLSAHFKYFLCLMWNISFVEVMRDFTSQTFRTKDILHRLFSLFLKNPILIQLLQWETRRERQRKVKDSKRHSPGDHFSTAAIHGKHFTYYISLCWKISISRFP